jgi:hypothetical protein
VTANGAGQLFARIAADRQYHKPFRSRAVQFAVRLGVDATASLPLDLPPFLPSRTINLMRHVSRVTILLLSASLCRLRGGGTGVFKKKDKVTVPGERVAVLVNEADIDIDTATAHRADDLPAAVTNDSWAQSGGNANKSVGHVRLRPCARRGLDRFNRPGAANKAAPRRRPVVAEGKVFTMDTTGTVARFDATAAARIWSARFGDVGDNAVRSMAAASPMIGKVYAPTAWLCRARMRTAGGPASVDSQAGRAASRVSPPSRPMPSMWMSQDNQIYSLEGCRRLDQLVECRSAGDRGRVRRSGAFRSARHGGRRLFESASSTPIATKMAHGLAGRAARDHDVDQRRLPVRHRRRRGDRQWRRLSPFGQGGRMVALDLFSGQRIWELNFGGISTPWLAGDWLFAVNDKAQLIAIARRTGKIRWINQLPRYRDMKDRKGPITYVGRICAANG